MDLEGVQDLVLLPEITENATLGALGSRFLADKIYVSSFFFP